MDSISIFIIAILVTFIGAIPLGLVNLSVMDEAFQQSRQKAMQIAHGAAWIEIAFGLFAILFGSIISYYTQNNYTIKYLVLLAPGIIGVIFLFKRKSKRKISGPSHTGYFRGMFLNLISIQVLLYWIIAISYLNTLFEIKFSLVNIILFTLGIWIGKMGVLWIYAYFSRRIFSKSDFLARNINRIIASILLLTMILQFIK